jgi:hypothetical protein
MYFGFFQNFDKVFEIAQKNTSSLGFIAQFFFSELFNNHTYQKFRISLFFVFFLNLKNHLKYSTFSMIFTFYLPFPFNLETFPFQVSNILVQKEF